jgi:hypothetical protein
VPNVVKSTAKYIKSAKKCEMDTILHGFSTPVHALQLVTYYTRVKVH